MKLFRKMKHLPWPIRWLIVVMLWVWRRTLRLRVEDPHGIVSQLHAGGQAHIYAVWHNRMLMTPFMAPCRIRRRIVFLASKSRDGGYIADVLNSLGMPAVRGSSSRGGGTALRELIGQLRSGNCVAVTPDGPRGPRYQVQDGVLWLASRSGSPVVPVAINAPRHKELRGWDRTQLPRPFSTIELVIGKPIYLDAELDDSSLAAAREEVRDALLAVCRYDQSPG